MPSDMVGWAVVLGVFIAMLTMFGTTARGLMKRADRRIDRRIDKRIAVIETNQVKMKTALDTVLGDLNNGVKARMANIEAASHRTDENVAKLVGMAERRRHSDG